MSGEFFWSLHHIMFCQGKLYRKMAQEADEKASMQIFKARLLHHITMQYMKYSFHFLSACCNILSYR